MPESHGGMLPIYAKCQLCAELSDRRPLNERVTVLGDEEEMSNLSIAAGGEEIDVRIQAAHVGKDGTSVEEVTEEIYYDCRSLRVAKSGGVWKYSVGTVNTFIDEDFFQSGTELDLAGAMTWGRYMTKDLPTEPNITREEVLDGMQEYIIFEWGV
jgi:hypothetical protein